MEHLLPCFALQSGTVGVCILAARRWQLEECVLWRDAGFTTTRTGAPDVPEAPPFPNAEHPRCLYESLKLKICDKKSAPIPPCQLDAMTSESAADTSLTVTTLITKHFSYLSKCIERDQGFYDP